MSERYTMRAELDEQRCLIEDQRIEIERQRHRVEVQAKHTARLQADLDAVQATLRRAVPILQSHPESPSNGNGRRGRHPGSETVSSRH